ncbi:hypothetical protein C0991_006832 [Blastosporella zonata]|nr:hypothetical protein C0991_006832 [Blastosporella zonata]
MPNNHLTNMFHYALPSSYSYSPPSLSLNSHSPAPLSNPRDRYLAALAEAKAAEADFRAAEAAQREEDQLRWRLEEIQYRKQEQLLRSRYDRIPATHLDTYPSYDRLTSLRQQVEAEERLRLVALREADIAQRRLQVEASRELEACLVRVREEALHRRQHEQKEQARLAALLSQSVNVAQHHCSCGHKAPRLQASCRTSCGHKPQQQSIPALHPILQAFLSPEGQVTAPIKPKPQVKHEDDIVEFLLKQLSGAETPAHPRPKSQREPDVGPQEFLEHVQHPAPQQIADLFLAATAEQSTSSPSGASSLKPAQSSQEASAKVAPASTVEPLKASKPTGASLKEQLEARLNNEYHSEVRDTIQAIFASLQDAENHPPASPTSKASSSSKGKAKAEDSTSAPSTTTPSTNPTSKDVVDSLNEIRSIEAAFHALESDFTFPATLDFIAAHIAPGSPASSDSESSSATLHLTYTSRNHPVRFYEQALGALLTHLDSVDSFGNDTLRASRKEVVSRVEKALEELEKEVEGRYRTWLSKEAKAATSSELTSVPEAPTSVTPATSEASDSTTAPETNVEPASTESGTDLSPSAISTSVKQSSQTLEPPATSEPVAEAQPDAPTDIPSIVDEPSVSLSSSSATIKGYEIDAEDTIATVAASSPTESADSFLLAHPEANAIPKRPTNKDSDDAASDWSEIEA